MIRSKCPSQTKFSPNHFHVALRNQSWLPYMIFSHAYVPQDTCNCFALWFTAQPVVQFDLFWREFILRSSRLLHHKVEQQKLLKLKEQSDSTIKKLNTEIQVRQWFSILNMSHWVSSSFLWVRTYHIMTHKHISDYNGRPATIFCSSVVAFGTVQIQSETIRMKVTIKYTKLQSATTRPIDFILKCVVQRSMTLQPSNSCQRDRSS